MSKSSDVVWQQALVTRTHREAMNGHRAGVLWFTGLSGAGKSTLAHAVELSLHQAGQKTVVLDGDNVRHGLCGDLGFSAAERTENLRRIAEVARLFVDAGIVVLAAFISPYQADRQRVREIVGDEDFFEIYCECPLDICESRDVKGMYRRARAGEIKDFTGISAPYEAPISPELSIATAQISVDAAVEQILAYWGQCCQINNRI